MHHTPPAPSTTAICAHLDAIAAAYIGGPYEDGLIEIAHTAPMELAPNMARLFALGDLDAAAEFAVNRNAAGCSVYVGATLRSPDANRNKRCDSDDFYCAAFAAFDVDEDAAAVSQRTAEAGIKPAFTVQTGTKPEPRYQVWVRLREICDEVDDLSEGLSGLVAHVGADPKVRDAARVLRLAGTIARGTLDPRKAAKGYLDEVTTFRPKPCEPVDLDRLAALDPLPGRESSGAGGHGRGGGTGEIERDENGIVIDGRETWFRHLLLSELGKYQRDNGADPTPDELFRLAYARFVETTDNSDQRWTSRRGQAALRKRATNTIRRLRQGKLAPIGLHSFETGVGQDQAEKVQAERERKWQARQNPFEGVGPSDDPADRQGASLQDFVAHAPDHKFIFLPTRELWPAASVDSRVPWPEGEDGKEIRPSNWLDRNASVEQMTWAPGEPELIRDRLMESGGFLDRPGFTCFNLYRAPHVGDGSHDEAGRWIEHVHRVYPDDAQHIINWLAQRVQRPQDKINHALVLGGDPGIGKDTLLEPAKQAVGPWNCTEISPAAMLGRFNGFVKSVILRISEARDLGDVDRFAFHDHAKTLIAAPPDVLRVDEKHRQEYSVPHVCGVIITTNHKTTGRYLPANDRRHYVAWSNLKNGSLDADYFSALYAWFENGGTGHVAAYLRQVDLSRFNPKAPPPKTEAFWSMVDAGRAPEDAELADVLDSLGWPSAVTIAQIIDCAKYKTLTGFCDWLKDRKNRRQIPHRMEEAEYEPIRNPAAQDGLWVIGGRRKVVYAKVALSTSERLAAAGNLT